MIMEDYFDIRGMRRKNRTNKENFHGGKPLTYFILSGFPPKANPVLDVNRLFSIYWVRRRNV